jgi:hypothetical protein
VINCYPFQKYTEVRRLVLLEFFDDDTAIQLLHHPSLTASLLLFILSDPKLM